MTPTTPFYRETPLDPEMLARDPFFFADHADELLAEIEARDAKQAFEEIRTGEIH